MLSFCEICWLHFLTVSWPIQLFLTSDFKTSQLSLCVYVTYDETKHCTWFHHHHGSMSRTHKVAHHKNELDSPFMCCAFVKWYTVTSLINIDFVRPYSKYGWCPDRELLSIPAHAIAHNREKLTKDTLKKIWGTVNYDVWVVMQTGEAGHNSTQIRQKATYCRCRCDIFVK